MLTALIAAAAVLSAGALEASPFAPPAKPALKIVRLLAPSGAFNARTLREFERESGFEVAYDAYGDVGKVPSLMKEGPYDLVILPGPALAQAISSGELRKIDRGQVANARRIAPPIAAKLLSYDPGGAYSLAWGWSATGLLYDAEKAPRLLGGLPNSWAAALAPDVARKLAPCGVALPNSRDEVFIAAWRLLGVNPSNLRERDVKAAADLIIRARAAVRLPKIARSDRGDRRRRGLSDHRRRGAGGDRHAPQPRGPGGLRHPLRRNPGGRADGDRRDRRAARRAPREAGGGPGRFSAASRDRRRSDRRDRVDERRDGHAVGQFQGPMADRRLRRQAPSCRRKGMGANEGAEPRERQDLQERQDLRKPAERDAQKEDEAMTAGAPNFLIVMADQMAPAFLPIYGHRLVRAPHIAGAGGKRRRVRQRLLQQPVVFAFARLVHGRASAVADAVYDNAAEFSADIPTFAHCLRLRGYRTTLAGKMHFCGPDQLHGFEERLTTDIYPADYGWTPDWDHPEERPSWYHNMSSVAEAGICVRTNQLDFDEEAAFMAERAIFDIARSKDRRPFLLVASFTHPHDPFAVPQRYWDLYRHEDIEPPSPAVPLAELDPHSSVFATFARWTQSR